jgi:hypothetical protein
MNKVMGKKRAGKEIFYAIDLHDRMMLAGIAAGKDEAVDVEFDTMPAGPDVGQGGWSFERDVCGAPVVRRPSVPMSPPGYPLAGCSPAGPASVSPGGGNFIGEGDKKEEPGSIVGGHLTDGDIAVRWLDAGLQIIRISLAGDLGPARLDAPAPMDYH